ncbi:MAG: hypothetical protein O7F12_06090 [Nitrospirae bacterium]|nr:hypothetical protein [Nitrospirota bacterium]
MGFRWGRGGDGLTVFHKEGSLKPLNGMYLHGYDGMHRGHGQRPDGCG